MAGLITQGQVIQSAGVFCGIFRSGRLIAGQRLLKKLLRLLQLPGHAINARQVIQHRGVGGAPV